MENHSGWGNRISWGNYPDRINGHLTPRPNVGDYVTCEMKTRRHGVFRITAIEYCHDPPDMFFADVEPIGYEDELKEPIPPEKPSLKRMLLS
jgi:hypothetical protein